MSGQYFFLFVFLDNFGWWSSWNSQVVGRGEFFVFWFLNFFLFFFFWSHNVWIVIFLTASKSRSGRHEVFLFFRRFFPHFWRQSQNPHRIPRIYLRFTQSVQTHRPKSVAQSTVIGIFGISWRLSIFLVKIVWLGFFANGTKFVRRSWRIGIAGCTGIPEIEKKKRKLNLEFDNTSTWCCHLNSIVTQTDYYCTSKYWGKILQKWVGKKNIEKSNSVTKKLPNMFWHILGIKVLEAKLSFFFSLSLQNLEHCVWISILGITWHKG